ncbi:Mss4-like protein [Parachaetomium inaequale]|uniref:Mss4-like protein n=1 Tax=Parachaetomium inaequale TaxID=2588326 RepID=A0AAN6PRW8_9PEZI|nr:Mss4-like protein [Parachaetomium inaequale]
MADSLPSPQPTEPPAGLPVSCQCGNITLTTPTPSPMGMSYCHCTTCRKQSGSAFGASVYFPTDLVFPLPRDLEAKLAVFEHPTDSGGTMRCFFCPKCGVRIFNAAVLADGRTMREMVAFKAGAIEEGWLDWKGLGKEHVFTRSAVIELAEGWVCYETMPGEGPAVVVKGEKGERG